MEWCIFLVLLIYKQLKVEERLLFGLISTLRNITDKVTNLSIVVEICQLMNESNVIKFTIFIDYDFIGYNHKMSAVGF